MKEQRRYVSYDTRFLQTGLDVLNMILLTEIENLSKLPGGCYASDEKLGELIMVGRKNTNERIKYLESLKVIECKTRFENGKRKRFIKFLKDKVELPQGNSSPRMRKTKEKTPNGNPSQSPYGNSSSLPQGGNNRLIEKEGKKKKSPEDPNIGSLYTGPNGKKVDDISIKSNIVEDPLYTNSNEEDLQLSADINITSNMAPVDITSISGNPMEDHSKGSSSNELTQIKGFQFSKFYEQLDPEQELRIKNLPMIEKLMLIKSINSNKNPNQTINNKNK